MLFPISLRPKLSQLAFLSSTCDHALMLSASSGASSKDKED